jgi:hypothetical protein
LAEKTISTDTASFAVFDNAALAHRFNDSCDWWSVPSAELHEVRSGNCVIFGTGCDGAFEFSVEVAPPSSEPSFLVVISAPSGRLYVGPGEDLPGDGMQPAEGSHHYCGLFVDVEPGNHSVAVASSGSKVSINITRTNEPAQNQISGQFLLHRDA